MAAKLPNHRVLAIESIAARSILMAHIRFALHFARELRQALMAEPVPAGSDAWHRLTVNVMNRRLLRLEHREAAAASA
jgi:hypothetical protein